MTRNSPEGCPQRFGLTVSLTSRSKPLTRTLNSRAPCVRVKSPIGSWSRTQKILVRMKPYSRSRMPSRRVTCTRVCEARSHSFSRARWRRNRSDRCLRSSSLNQGLALGPARRRQALAQKIVLEAVVQRILKQLELDVGERILVKLELGFDRGHLVLEQSVAFRADAAKLVVEANRVEPADLAVFEQFLDVGEVEVGVVRQGLLLFVGRRRD